MNKYIKKSLSLSIGALLSTAAFAETYTYDLDEDTNLLTTTVDGVTYTYQFDSSPTPMTSSIAKDGTGSISNRIYDNVTGTDATGSSIQIKASTGTVASISSIVFINNESTVTGSSAGAIFMAKENTVTSLDGMFIGNSATNSNGGAITTFTATSVISTLTGTFVNNYAGANGGAIYNVGTIGLNAINYDTVFTGNTDSTGSNAIYNTGTVTFNSSNGYSVIVNDGISGSSGTMKIQTGTTVFNNVVSNQIITVANAATLELGSYGTDSADLTGSTVTVNGTLSLVVNELSSIDLSSTTFGTNGTLVLDLSDIYGDFSLDIDNAGASLTEFTLLLDDNSTEVFSLEAGDYDVSSDLYSSLSVSLSGTTYTISGIATAAVPEPSTYAMIFGVVALGFAAYRRRK